MLCRHYAKLRTLGATMLTPQNAYDLAKSYSKDLGEILPDIYFDVEPVRFRLFQKNI